MFLIVGSACGGWGFGFRFVSIKSVKKQDCAVQVQSRSMALQLDDSPGNDSALCVPVLNTGTQLY